MTLYFVNTRHIERVRDRLAEVGAPRSLELAKAVCHVILIEGGRSANMWIAADEAEILSALDERLSGTVPSRGFFDDAFYAAMHGVAMDQAFAHWCRAGIHADFAFNPLFDPDFYRGFNGGELSGLDSATLHFLNRGLFDGRVCSEWIASLDFMVGARPEGGVPVLLDLYSGTDLPLDDRYVPTVEHAGPFATVYDAYRFDAIGKCLTGKSLDSYELMLLYSSATGRMRTDRPREAEWLQLLAADFPERAGSRLIDGPFIAETAGKLCEAARVRPVSWWLVEGRRQGVVPNSLFSKEFYRRSYPDIGGWDDFEHYLLHGRFEGRLPFDGCDLDYCRRRYGIDARQDTLDYLLGNPASVTSSLTFLESLEGRSENGAARLWLSKVGKARYFDAALSAEAKRAHAFASQLDPLIELAEGRRIVWVPDAVSDKPVRAARLRHAARGLTGRIAVLAPSTANGGSWTVCLNVLEWLGDKACLILTDSQSRDVDALRKRFDVIDMPALGCGGDVDLLYDVLRGIECRTAFNINSATMWEMLATQGRNISSSIDVYAFLFCFHHDRHDRRDGYSARYVVPAMRHVAGFIIDNAAHRDELIALHGADFAARSTVVYHRVDPPRSRGPSAGEDGAIWWAGRFDRQKKFDMLLEMARRFPDENFKVWGFPAPDEAVLASWPENVAYQGQFKRFDDLDFADCKVWLFTSRFEGMPITLVEVAGRGVPVMSTIVGGTGEIVTDETGWPVKGREIDDYAEVLSVCLDSAGERARRAKAAAKLIGSRHSKAHFEASLANFSGVRVR